MKLALFGGSFDPPHLGHLAFARLALQQLQPDRLLWLPAGRPWQKAGRQMATPEHRVAMVRLLTADEPRFGVDERELHRVGPSFTVDTLREFHREQPGSEIDFLIGQDQYLNLHTWYQAEEVLHLTRLVVVPRGGQAVRGSAALPPHEVQTLNLPDHPVSSTAVRHALARGDDISPLVGPQVAGYIAQHRLYRNP